MREAYGLEDQIKNAKLKIKNKEIPKKAKRTPRAAARKRPKK
jgi:hypothetical protein